MSESPCARTLLLIDTCAPPASIALFQAGEQAGTRMLPDRMASAALLGAVQELLGSRGLSTRDLAGVGVVNGPGSFTGLRVGLAFAKGLCEAANLPMAAVSRLAVLTHAAGLQDGFAVLSAGREQMYVRAADGGEYLTSSSALAVEAHGKRIVCTATEVAEALADLGAEVHTLSAADAFGPVCACFAGGESDPALVDANYVRDQAAIYRRAQG